MQQFLPDCSDGRDAAVTAGLQLGTRCSSACRTAGWDSMQQFLPNCMEVRDSTLPAGLQVGTR